MTEDTRHQAVLNLIKFLQEKTSSRKKEDPVFAHFERETKKLMELYAENPYNVELINTAKRVAEGFEQVSKDSTTFKEYERSRVANAVVLSRLRRTHYSAYLAGRYSADDDVGYKYKCWAHNAAATGAISLYEVLAEVTKEFKKNSLARLVKTFQYAIRQDALQFLEFAHDNDPASVLTSYNRAKMGLLSSTRDLMESGINELVELKTPNEDSHTPDLYWHIDNYVSYNSKHDKKMREVIKVNFGHQDEVISEVLRKNSQEAQTILEARPNRWESEEQKNRGFAVAMAVGATAASIVYLNPETQDWLAQLLTLFDSAFHVAMNEPVIETVALGDGGLPFSKVAVATFGDGGLPFSSLA
jgi:hypothetical protein